MLASSEVLCYRRCIPTYRFMYLDQSFYCQLSADHWKDGHQKIHKDSLDAAHFPRHFAPVILSCTLVGLGSRLVPWENPSNMLKARCRPTKYHWNVELKVD